MKKTVLIGLAAPYLLLSSITSIGQTQSLNFDGLNGYIELGNIYQFDTNSAFTIEAWIKTTNTNGVHQIISKIDPSDKYKGWGLQIEDDDLQLYLVNDWAGNISRWYSYNNAGLDDGNWHHVAASHDGIGSCKLYIDGLPMPVITQGAVSQSIVNTVNVQIGAYLDGATPFEVWDGNLDDIRIWDDVRTDSEISNNKDCPLTGTEVNLIGYWDLEEGTGMSTADKAANETGTITTGAMWSSDQGLNCSIGENELRIDYELHAYPNPFKSVTSIQCTSNFNNATVQLFDAQGKMIMDFVLSGGYSFQIDRGVLPSGTYHLRLLTDEGMVQYKKLLIL